jgi:hypothetical protein
MSPANTARNPFIEVLIGLQKAMTRENLVCLPIGALGLRSTDMKDLTIKGILSMLLDGLLNVLG